MSCMKENKKGHVLAGLLCHNPRYAPAELTIPTARSTIVPSIFASPDKAFRCPEVGEATRSRGLVEGEITFTDLTVTLGFSILRTVTGEFAGVGCCERLSSSSAWRSATLTGDEHSRTVADDDELSAVSVAESVATTASGLLLWLNNLSPLDLPRSSSSRAPLPLGRLSSSSRSLPF